MSSDKNHLEDEKSRYLQQHSDNPVDWYPWCDEAFEKAKGEDKPIFLSIGYSSCHWCHVMAHESFTDDQVAELMNDTFVNIKVDKEERPEVDSFYMKVAVAMTGSGGWPLTIVMTPEKVPFFAATYIPKRTRYGRSGMLELIPRIKQMWENKRAELEEDGQRILAALEKGGSKSSPKLTQNIFDQGFREIEHRYDERNGGFGNSPKFPMAHNLLFLLRYWKENDDEYALEMVKNTLKKMRCGGVYDHIGYGFHRYSTDSRWKLPHFEKMLYDQAMLMLAYTEAYQATGESLFKRTVYEIIDYVNRELTSPGGAFYSAQDADTPEGEGAYYTWRESELDEILGKKAELIKKMFNTEKKGNFEDEATGKKTGKNVFYLKNDLKNALDKHGLTIQEYEEMRTKLLDSREKRSVPEVDEKILTNWNGLMTAALSRAAFVFDDEVLLKSAKRASDFIVQELLDGDTLLHSYIAGESKVDGNLEDYSFFIWGLLELYQAGFDIRYLRKAVKLTRTMLELFWDGEDGGLFFTSERSHELPYRTKEVSDGAIPSGNSIALFILSKLAHLTGETEFDEYAQKLIDAFSGNLMRIPSQHTMLLSALFATMNPGSEIVIVGDRDDEVTTEMLDVVRNRFLPSAVLLLKNSEKITEVAPYAEGMNKIDEKPTVYMCTDFTCGKPTTNVERFKKSIEGDLGGE
ncbi:MAG: thioredoxin domain-containing protein [Thermoplasmata archaeon]